MFSLEIMESHGSSWTTETDEEEFSRCASGCSDSVSKRWSDKEVDTDPLIKLDQDEGAAMIMNMPWSAFQRTPFAESSPGQQARKRMELL